MTNALMSPEVDKVFDAYISAMGMIDNVTQDREVEVPIRDKQNPGQFKGKYKFRYATLAGTLNHIRHALISNGIWFTQRVDAGNMVTRILHRSGQWFDTGHLPLPNLNGSPQDVGGHISYFKRYSLGAAFGLASEDDLDGQNESEVNFNSRGNPALPVEDEGPKVIVPDVGWGDWARKLISDVAAAETIEALDILKSDNRRFINGAAKVERHMHADIAKAFTNRQSILDDKAPF